MNTKVTEEVENDNHKHTDLLSELQISVTDELSEDMHK